MIHRIARLLKFREPLSTDPGALLASGATVPVDGTAGYQKGCIFQHTDGSTGTTLYLNEGTYSSCAFVAIGTASHLVITTPPVSYVSPSLGVGVYGTPVVETALVDNIAFSVNVQTATNKTAADTSCIAAYIGCSNSANTTNDKIQALLVSTTLGGNCYDAYAVQGHITVNANMATQNANAHITGVSGKALLSHNNTQGWVTGVLAIVDGTGTTGGICNVIAAQVEATTTANEVDSILRLGADQTVPVAIELVGVANMTSFAKVDSIAGCVVSDALVPATAPGADTVGADAALKIMIGAVAYYIPLYDTLHN
jgi:hypothetical protein